MERHDYLEAAVRIGRRIVEQAIWQGPVCTWEVKAPDRERPERRSVPQVASGTVYQGSSGIACFLGELYRLSGDRDVGRTAEAAIRHALGAAAELPETSFGFHSGRVGIAYVAARLGKILERPDFCDDALRVLTPLAGKEDQDGALDVIGGAGGAVPALLQLSRELGSQQLLEVAGALGDHLIQVTHREPGGWSWGMASGSIVQNLTGLAHGTAGMGLALLELYQATGCGKYRFAAEMAFLYERRFFDEETSNWPDLRHKEIGDYVYYGRMEELRKAAAADAVSRYEPKYMSAWCHGSPGIGLSRVRAFEITGQPLYREETEAALRSTLASLDGSGLGNFSLCHGVAGNCELPLYAGAVFEDPSLREACERWAARGWESYEQAGRPWPCGTMAAESDPSLMLGEAGIGYFFLRLFSPETPSILLLRPPPLDRRDDADQESFEELRQLAVGEYLGETLESFHALQQRPVSLAERTDDSSPLDKSPVEAAYEALRQRVEQTDGAREEQLADAFRRERGRYELALELRDFTVEYLRALTRVVPEEVPWRSGQFRLADHSRLVTNQWDWDGWLAARKDGAESAEPLEEEVYSLLYRQGNRIHLRRISPFAALILVAVETPLPLEEIVARVAEAIAGGIDRGELAEQVLLQVQQLYQAGFVDCSEVTVSE